MGMFSLPHGCFVCQIVGLTTLSLLALDSLGLKRRCSQLRLGCCFEFHRRVMGVFSFLRKGLMVFLPRLPQLLLCSFNIKHQLHAHGHSYLQELPQLWLQFLNSSFLTVLMNQTSQASYGPHLPEVFLHWISRQFQIISSMRSQLHPTNRH